MEADRIRVKPFLIACAGLFFLEGAGGLVMGAQWRYPMAVLVGVRASEIGMLIGVFAWWGGGPADLGLGRDQIPAGLKRGVLWSLGFGALVLIGFGVLFMWGKNPLRLFRARLPADPYSLFWYLLAGGLMAPVGEEIFFRGVVYAFFRRWGILPALGISSLVFVSAHSTTALPVTQTVGGVLFAVSYEVEGKLMTPITIHVLGNLALFSLSFFS